MNPKTIDAILELAVIAAKLIGELKAQSGLTDEQLLAQAEAKNAETRDKVKAFLEVLK